MQGYGPSGPTTKNRRPTEATYTTRGNPKRAGLEGFGLEHETQVSSSGAWRGLVTGQEWEVAVCEDAQVDVRRPALRGGGVRALEPEAAGSIGNHRRTQARRVAPLRIGLPELHLRAAERLAVECRENHTRENVTDADLDAHRRRAAAEGAEAVSRRRTTAEGNRTRSRGRGKKSHRGEHADQQALACQATPS